MNFEILTVTFSGPLRDSETVSLNEAWVYFERENYSMHPTSARIRHTVTGEEFNTFAKGFFVWDEKINVYRLARIGLGAYGDDGVKNPAFLHL